MINKLSALILCGLIILCFASCGKDNVNGTPTSESASTYEGNKITAEPTTEPVVTAEKETTTEQPTTGIVSDPTKPIVNEESDTDSKAVFNTDNIARITFYAYYGYGKGSAVPAENMAEIIKWLGTFTVDKKAEDIPPPGTNTYYVEIEYLDGTVVKEGLDTISVNGVTYYLKHAANPDCFSEIISKTSIE